MTKKIEKFSSLLRVFPSLLLLAGSFSSAVFGKYAMKDLVQDFYDEPSIWDSDPIEIDSVNIQILDKISGKVYRVTIKLNSKQNFRSIGLELKRCFKNSPEDDKEISAFVQITENGKIIFSNWLFASSPSINLFSHPMYDIRIEF
jgi:hypothetical protein